MFELMFFPFRLMMQFALLPFRIMREVFRSGCTFHRGNGRIFYFQPGHESFPTYYDPNVQTIIRNAVEWVKPTYRVPELLCPHVKKPGEEEE